ncbi:extracellular solute-binding protein [Microvirga sp. GCM10011540]|uniref:extracellular solute-binding protein n=1 Tax=Microvirga sp. GCM10011540 TaxID=3317338 RepID=UPI0036099268
MIRRLLSVLVALYLGLLPTLAQEGEWQHGLALMGEPKYQPGFRHFDYVNPNAPKGGLVRFGAQGTFDNLNLVVAGVKGELEAGISQIYDTLMTSSMDEVGTEYGLLAEAVRYPADYSSVTYRLRPEARWHDGKPVTPEDVIFSFEALKTHSPLYAFYYRNVAKAEKTGEHEVTFTFNETGNRELPQIVGQLPVLPKHWWEATGPDGRKRNIGETTLEPPLGSGPYRLKSFEAGRTASYERVPDYWGKDLNVNQGRNNFDEVRYEYFRDATVLLEAFKGDRIDYRSENIARQWATAYDFPAARDGRVVLEEFPLRAMGVMQALVFNLRRDKFKDERVRRAFNLALDFEDINRTLFYGLYDRIDSFFFGTELAATGLPEGQELAILKSLGDKVPASVFTTPYRNPVNGTNEAVRANLREAMRLLDEAGYELRGGRMVNKTTGEPLTAEFITADSSFERVILPYKQALERIGIGLTVRVLDPAQYQNRIRAFDFDLTTNVWAQSLSPGNEQREYWGSNAADRPGSQNLAGIKDPAVDALIERIIFAKDRAELVAATKALDRVLLHHNYVVPQWYSLVTRTARWNRFGRPENLPRYGGSAFPTVWWYDRALAEKVGTAR